MAAGVLLTAPLWSHKPVNTRYTFYQHILPVFEKHCAGCHRRGGPAPMPLGTFEEARPWLEAIKEEVLLERMPPWPVEESVFEIEGARGLSAREIDRLLDWGAGGAPRGSAAQPGTAPDSRPAAGARAPPSRASLELALEHTLDAQRKEELVVRRLKLDLPEDRWLAEARFLPGSAAAVHDAVIYLLPPESGDASKAELLLAWSPGGAGVRYPDGTGRKVPKGSALEARLRYRRPWSLQAAEVKDRSAIELLFREGAPGRAVTVMELRPEHAAHLQDGSRVLSLTPLAPPAGGQAELWAESRGEMRLLLRTRRLDPAWPMTFRLAEPWAMPEGTTLAIKTSPAGGPAALWIEALGPGPRN
ncbi:MAG: hypothetical protein HY717_23020 [Planctomycetes bacterium]|nr:hypothetical protein [Planctomycetota bacterium]